MIQPLVGKAAKARSLFAEHHAVVIYEGSVRSSKTVTSLLDWCEYVRTGPAGTLLMVGKTERTLRRNIIDPLVEMLGSRRAHLNAGSGEFYLLGRKIELAGANDAKAEDKIRGLTLAGVYIDEVSLLPEQFFAMLLSRLSVEGAQAIGTTNPDNPNHWLMRDHLSSPAVWLQHDGSIVRSSEPDAKARDLLRLSFNMRDNPTLSPTYVARLAATYVGLWRKRFIDGLWVLAEGAVYDTFDPDPASKFIVDDLPRDPKSGQILIQEWAVCIDYGTTNPFVALLIGVGHNDRLYVAREWRHDSRKAKRQMTDAEYSKALRTWLADLDPLANDIPSELPGAREPHRILVDPSAASFIAQLYRDQWYGVAGADNTVDDGIRSVATLLGCGMLLIHQSCAGLRAEMSGYVWDKKAADAGEERPLKVDDHAPDALRYGVMGLRRWWRQWLSVAV